MARTQRDSKVTLCHDIWNGSHTHLIIVAWDAYACVNFYAEIQKKITDALKRLLGLSHLIIWEGDPMVCELGDLERAKERIVYLYENPSQDNLVESIDKFPGYSSWREFLKCKGQLAGTSTEMHPWIRLPSIPELSSPMPSPREDDNVVRLLRHRNKAKHQLVRKPNDWMRCFGVTKDEDAEKINTEIIAMLREREDKHANDRKKDNRTVMGVAKLTSQPILADHTPKKNDRRIYINTSVNEIRMKRIREHRHFSEECRRCYEAWKRGDFTVVWPEGAFKPPLPPNFNYLPDGPPRFGP